MGELPNRCCLRADRSIHDRANGVTRFPTHVAVVVSIKFRATQINGGRIKILPPVKVPVMETYHYRFFFQYDILEYISKDIAISVQVYCRIRISKHWRNTSD